MVKEPKGRKIHWEESGLNQITWLRKVKELPSMCEHAKNYKTHYELWTYGGKEPLMYVAKSYIDIPNNKEVVIWYRNGNMNGGCRQTIIEAIKMGIESAVYYFK